MSNETKSVYVVISYTGTVLARVIKLLTHKDYSHASITPYEDLHIMYSFGRKNAYNPFIGGFVDESASFGTFKRFYNTEVIVLEVPTNNEDYHNMCEHINQMVSKRKSYKYNYLGLYLAALNICHKRKNGFYCSEYVKYMLKEHNVSGAGELEDIVHPMSFLNLPESKTIYKGKLRDFSLEKICI